MEGSLQTRPNQIQPQLVTITNEQRTSPATASGSPGGESAAGGSGISTLSVSHQLTPSTVVDNKQDAARRLSIFD